MASWELLSDEIAREVWDQYLIRFSNFTFYQLYAWGEHRRCFGWTPFRWIAYGHDREIVAMVQALYRPYKLGVGMLWSSGGPVGDISTWGSLQEVILESTRAKNLYYRFFSNREATKDDQEILKSQGWKPCIYKLRSGLSMRLRLDRDREEILRGFSGNWRHNLNRSRKSKLAIRQWIDPNIDDILTLYKSMESHKNLEQQFSRRELESIFRNLANRIVLYRCDDENDQLVALRGCMILDRFGWDLFAAANVAGRNLYASYALLWEVLRHCQRMGVKEFDLMGIDPVKNPGVYNFKKGTGGEFVEYLGEWDWATSKVLRGGVNMAVRLRRSSA